LSIELRKKDKGKRKKEKVQGKIIIGVTGGLATGKTTVTDIFVELGASRIDADEISHGILEEDGGVRNKVVGLFGPDILEEGKVDRRKLAEKVFFDGEKLKALCGILHPPIMERIRQKALGLPGPVIALDAPLLIEAALQDFVDVVVLVSAGDGTQIERARARGISEKEARAIIACQMPLSDKAKFADYIIENDKDLDTLKEGVKEIWQRMRK
jgi:dephospho-CoA kinase